MRDYIEVHGGNIHNLKNIDVKIPKNKLTVITGVSGSGKSSLAFDILYEEGKKRYLMFSDTQFMIDTVSSFDSIQGISPTVAVEQRIIRQSNPRSTVGTRTKISNMLGMFFSTFGKRDEDYNDGIPLSVTMFQKNSPRGMCVKCLGKGHIHKIDEDKLFGDRSKQIDELVFGLAKRGITGKKVKSFCKYHGLSIAQKVNTLTTEEFNYLKYGDGGKTIFPGFIPWILKGVNNKNSRLGKLLIENECLTIATCPKCKGTGLSQQAIHTTISGKSIVDLENMYIKELHNFLERYNKEIDGNSLIDEILIKLKCMMDLGLHHLSLSRPVPTLSGGEVQRLFLATFIIVDMDSIIFILDEPTIGLHEIEKENLIRIIKNLVNKGNTVIAVEHDENFIKKSDYIIDLGPGAGVFGGDRIFQGVYNDFIQCRHSNTAPYLSGDKEITIKSKYRFINRNKVISMKNAKLNNLKDISINIPLGVIVGIAGVSGSGKSSLITETLVPKLKEVLKIKAPKKVFENNNYKRSEGVVLKGFEDINKCVIVDQKPIGRSKISCPATYVGIFNRIRKLFANTEKAKKKGYKSGMFSLNSKGGCGSCKGEGVIHYHVGYGNFIDMECQDCGGTGFLEEALEIKLYDKNIREVLEMSVLEGVEFFENIDKITHNMLKTLNRVGLGYIKLGQKTTTISGGEAQRIKLAKELAKKQVKNSLYIFDEPTTGLSFYDRENLMYLIQELCDKGNSIIITEHDPVVLSNCDYIIEMGPGGGRDGGSIIATGSPKELKGNKKSIIGRWLYG